MSPFIKQHLLLIILIVSSLQGVMAQVLTRDENFLSAELIHHFRLTPATANLTRNAMFAGHKFSNRISARTLSPYDRDKLIKILESR